MKRAAFVALCLAFGGCGVSETGDCSCAAAVVWHGDVYLGHVLNGRQPAPGADVAGGIVPGCCDEDRPADLRRVGDVPPEVALYLDGDDGSIYLSRHYKVFLPDPGYRIRARGRRCRIAGPVSYVDGHLRIGARRIRHDERTRFAGFDRALPYLADGDRVTVHGFACPGMSMVARRIALQP